MDESKKDNLRKKYGFSLPQSTELSNVNAPVLQMFNNKTYVWPKVCVCDQCYTGYYCEEFAVECIAVSYIIYSIIVYI